MDENVGNNGTKEELKGIGSDDYSVARVPLEAKSKVWRITVLRLGVLACLPLMMMGAQIGYVLPFWDGVGAVLLGSVILQAVGWALGTIAAREGLSTSLMSRWTGFGRFGSSILGLIIAIVCLFWFGIQNGVFAEGLYMLTGVLNVQIWALITGLIVTFIVIYGLKMMGLIANILLPVFIVGVFIAFFLATQQYDIIGGLTAPPPAPGLMSFGAVVTMVTGGFIMGAIITPDMSRYLKNGKQVFIMVAVSTFVGELVFCSIAAIMAHHVGSPDIVAVVYTISGLLGIIVIVSATTKANTPNLYVATLGITNLIEGFSKKKFHRGTMTLIFGIIGTVLSVLGVLNLFVGFMSLLGVVLPPIAGIMVVDYFFLKRSRKELDESRERGELPEFTEKWNIIGIISWAVAIVFAFLTPEFGIQSINSLILSGVLYLILMKLFDPKIKAAAALKKQG